jgi:hypothetical protein
MIATICKVDPTGNIKETKEFEIPLISDKLSLRTEASTRFIIKIKNHNYWVKKDGQLVELIYEK